MKITNESGIALSMAVWLLHDEYDYIKDQNYISATALMKPLRQIVLGRRLVRAEMTADVADYIPRALGHSLHDSIEKAWVKGHRLALHKLGFPQHVIDRVLVNPTPEQLAAVKDPIPVYLEQRAIREINGYKVGGKFDMVAEGIVHDNKSTSAYTWVYGGRDKEHQLQGSLYRWLNPDKITEDFIRINYIFTDWQRAQVGRNPKYPPQRLMSKDIPLLSVEETERWITNKLKLVEQYMDAPEKDIPYCTDEELWKSDDTYKYYTDPAKTSGRSPKNFTSKAEATAYHADKGWKGVIITVPGEAKRCGYCDAFDVCTQKDRYFQS